MNKKSVIRSIDNASLNCEITKPQFRALAKKALAVGLIDQCDFEDIGRILADRDQCAEDALSELSGWVNISSH